MRGPSKDPADYRDGQEDRSLFEATRSLTTAFAAVLAGVSAHVLADLTHVPILILLAPLVVAVLVQWLRRRRA